MEVKKVARGELHLDPSNGLPEWLRDNEAHSQQHRCESSG
jgi:hypothetical protein